MKEYQKLTDEQLLEKIEQGEEPCMELLIERYKGQVKKQAKALYLMGGDSDDLIQEGMIGLFKAIRDYCPQKEASFESFALLCISRQMYSAIQASNRQKHAPLNSYVELSPEMSEGSGGPMERDPEELFIDRENMGALYEEIEKRLSPFEQEVLSCYLGGRDYLEIADMMQKSAKSIDNALQRIRRKLTRS